MSTCWQTLDILQTTDVKAIKSAYAVKLKSNRPDEKPDEFQQLHRAYKEAVHYAKSVLHQQAQESIDTVQHESAVITEQSSDQSSDQVVQDEAQPLSAEEQAEREQLERDYRELTERIERIIADPALRNEKDEWQFLLSSPLILDPNVNSHLGLFVLKNIDEHNLNEKEIRSKKQTRKHKKYTSPNDLIGERTIKRLDKIFNWSGQLNMVNYYLGTDVCERLLPSLENRNLNQEHAAIESVKGGEIKKKKIKINAAQEYGFIVEAYENAGRLFTWVAILSILASAVMFADKVNRGLQTDMYLHVLFVFCMGALWYGYRKKHKFAYLLMWLVGLSLLAAVPIGTIIGGLILINLYKAARYYQY